MSAGPPPSEHSPLWGVAASVASRTTLIVALLFYFGWASARETYSYFGINTSLLGLSTSDYLLRSVYSAYQPALFIGIGVVVAVGLHQVLLRLAARDAPPGWLRRVPIVAVVAGAAMGIVGVAGLADQDVGWSLHGWLPALLAAGAAVGAYANRAWPVLRGPADPAAERDREVREFLLLALTLLGLFWWTGLFAVSNGRHSAERIARDLPSATAVRVYSQRSLSLPASCAHAEALPGTDRFRYRYSELRLIVHSGGHYFLVPSCWKHGATDGNGVTFQISDGPDVRLDLQPGP